MWSTYRKMGVQLVGPLPAGVLVFRRRWLPPLRNAPFLALHKEVEICQLQEAGHQISSA